MGQDRPGVNPRGFLLKMLAVKGGPGLFLHDRQAVREIRDAPAMAVNQPFLVSAALRHQRVLRVDEAAFDPGWLVGPEGIKTTHEGETPEDFEYEQL